MSEYEAQLEGAYTRMQAGDAPTDDIDQEWKRMVRLQETRQKEDMFRKQVSDPVHNVCRGSMLNEVVLEYFTECQLLTDVFT